MGGFATGLGFGLSGTQPGGQQGDQSQQPKKRNPFTDQANAIADKLSPPGQAKPGMPGAVALPPGTQAAPSAAAAPAAAQDGAGADQFHGLIPKMWQAYQNHEKTNMHLNALKDPNITPEWRQYHTTQLQQMHQNNPQWLQQNGFPPPGQTAPAPAAPQPSTTTPAHLGASSGWTGSN